MPKRTPAEEANENFVVRIEDRGLNYGPFLELTPARVKAIIREADLNGEVGPLYGIYDRMETTDTHYGGLVGQLKAAIGGFRLKVMPAEGTTEEEKAIAEDYAAVMSAVVNALDAATITKMFTAPYITGAKVYLLRWAIEDFAYGRKLWFPTEIVPVEGDYLAMDTTPKGQYTGELMIRTTRAPSGEVVKKLPESSYILLESEYGRGRYHKLGAARKCLPWYLGIQYVQSWWIQYIEGYGAPMRIGRYPRGGDLKARSQMEGFLRALGQNGYALFPADMELQLIEANRQGTITTYGDFIQKGHIEYAIALLGQAQTSSSSKGEAGLGYASMVVANSIRYEILQEVASIVERGWRELSRRVIRANYGDAMILRLLPRIKPVTITPYEMSTKADTFTKLQEAGVPVSADYPYEQILGTPPPREGEEAFLHGQRFVFGVDKEPEPRGATMQRGQQEDRNREQQGAEQERSVSQNNTERTD